jgi:transcriptional regulator with PAS, ATPase and Fis domain
MKREIPVVITAAVLHDKNGRILGGVESFQDDRARQALEKEVKGSYDIEDFITRDESILFQLSRLPTIANSAKPVLILGETGVGKDILARIIHNTSNRKLGPYIKVNCAAIPSTMLESELLGYKKGAFTDAKNDKPGKFQLAQNGTIFLDEIGELDFDMQAKLLQVIEDKEYYPLGATEMEWVNARILASTNCDLERMLQENRFRKDLYYRLKMCEFTIPPLRERSCDIPLLIDHFLSQAAAINNQKKPDITSKAWDILTSYHYPGNIRECKNIIEYALMVCKQSITPSDLPHYLLQHVNTRSEGIQAQSSDKMSFEQFERISLQRSLQDHDWSIQNTAESLGINRTTLWRKMKKHGLVQKRRK